MSLNRAPRSPALVLAWLVCLLLAANSGVSLAAIQQDSSLQAVKEKIRKEGSARVVVKLDMPRQYRREAAMSRSAALRQRADIRAAQRNLRDRLRGTAHKVRREFASVPYMAMDIDAAALARLQSAGPDGVEVYEDIAVEPLLDGSILQIEADLAHAVGFDGAGNVVVIVDTGVDASHSFLSGKVLAEACFAYNEDGVTGACPNGQPTQYTAGAAVPCPYAPWTCRHGTHVAGIAAGSGASTTGVAPAADLIAIQVFHPTGFCFGRPDCAVAFMSDITAALEHVDVLKDQYPIASVNMSIGGGSYSGDCDAQFPFMLAAIDNLVSAGIATVVASGNNSTTAGISAPACISSAISVSAVDENDNVADFASVSSSLDLFAPGVSIDSSIPGGSFASFSGTSMAAPHVAGAWAVLSQLNPAATVADNLSLLETTGKTVVDDRGGSGVSRPRIRLSGAVGIENPVPVVSSLSPAAITAWGPEATVTVNGSGFTRSSVILIDGQPAATTLVSGTELAATLTTDRLQTSSSSFSIQVQSPPPGGGTTASTPLTVLQPSLGVSTQTVLRGDPVTVTLTNAPGRPSDWLTFAAVGSPNTSFTDWIYVPSGSTSFSWTINAPSQFGDYEFRLLSAGSYTGITNSPVVSVESPAPSITSISPVRVAANTNGVNITVAGDGFTSDTDILVDGVARPTTYTSSTQLVAALPASDLATAATSLLIEASTPAPGGGTSNAMTLQIAHPVLTPSATSVAPGATMSVTLTDGVGNTSDWIALASVGASDTSVVEWVYVGAGVTETTWSLTMPTTEGDYEFRLFEDGSYNRLTTSVTVNVGGSGGDPPDDPPVADPVLDVSATAVTVGDPVTVTLTDGPGNASDWIALASVGSANTSIIEWVYVGSGQTTTSWTVNMPATAGDYEFRLFENNGYTLLATSATVTVDAGNPDPPDPPTPADPVLDVTATLVTVGEEVTVTLTDGPGNASDWIALASVGSPNTSIDQWVYVGAGQTSTSWTVNMPSTAGDYEFRLFENNGYTLLATSTTVTVEAAPSEPDPPENPQPALEVSANLVSGGATVTATLTDGPGNSRDWLALAGVGDPDTSYLQWVYVDSGSSTATWTVTMPATFGDYEFRLFENGGYTRLATSPTVTVGQ